MAVKVAIVGGGVAGLASAYWLARKGFYVSVYERHREIGFNPDGVRCGEAHLIRENEQIYPPKTAVSKEVKGVLLHAAGRKYTVTPKNARMVVLDKPRFLRFLADIAEKEGAEIITGRRISTKRDIGENHDIIIDASGCKPVFKSLEISRCGITYQETIEDCNIYPGDMLEQYWLHDRLGYLWIFPKNDRTDTVNIGVGWLITADRGARHGTRTFLKRWKEEHGVEGEILRKTSGIVPLGYQRPLIAHDVVFAGDACMGADELTGAGIIRALHNARIIPDFLHSANINERAYFKMLASDPTFRPLPLFRTACSICKMLPRSLLYPILFRLTAKRLNSELV
ncbi:MAG: NAD(P)/FAD-dependent oxidoreductase [Canidatus Methanoxibalbensis ujae]|nr:NAD(P)/FAD-dependent oxidoreductase [Candidatus Methanoxibalbensis ujae]MCW7079054.1 NAD(P)/FAD-dependent oxidoreductase [Candidatus Methanoxibalbensis ujae]